MKKLTLFIIAALMACFSTATLAVTPTITINNNIWWVCIGAQMVTNAGGVVWQENMGNYPGESQQPYHVDDSTHYLMVYNGTTGRNACGIPWRVGAYYQCNNVQPNSVITISQLGHQYFTVSMDGKTCSTKAW